MSKNVVEARQGAKPEVSNETLLPLLDAVAEANTVLTPREVAREHNATLFHLSEGGAVTVRGRVQDQWPAEYWRPMTEAATAGRYHAVTARGGQTALVLEVTI